LQLAPAAPARGRHQRGARVSAEVLVRCRKCARGIDALKLYRAEYDDKLQALRPRPVDDWTSHAADAFRYLALTLDNKAAHSGFYRRIDYPQHGVV
jgi:hypothetical protein